MTQKCRYFSFWVASKLARRSWLAGKRCSQHGSFAYTLSKVSIWHPDADTEPLSMQHIWKDFSILRYTFCLPFCCLHWIEFTIGRYVQVTHPIPGSHLTFMLLSLFKQKWLVGISSKKCFPIRFGFLNLHQLLFSTEINQRFQVCMDLY